MGSSVARAIHRLEPIPQLPFRQGRRTDYKGQAPLQVAFLRGAISRRAIDGFQTIRHVTWLAANTEYKRIVGRQLANTAPQITWRSV
jgi:hypothetical protein